MNKKSQIKQYKTKVSDDDLNSLYQYLQDRDESIDISLLRDKIQEFGLDQECQVFMEKTKNPEETPYLKIDQLKNWLDIDYNNERDFKFIFSVMTKINDKDSIDEQTLQNLNKKYKLDLTKEDIDMMIKYANKDSKNKTVSMKELREFILH
ncbi:hypothetical protein TTHERM_00238930 (macronuclear) [Tetrahymena thermophila SB210]|uniref:Uncharacterized protein n=1 Tax=Tetrahymena thermophila (strain SB210) TaxID=312017 RepID=I7MAG9_TETTS|nr:hypothetical protein TTHERM_00238930 [Tetrahymena thermophila SB210]EAS04573.1 hypothetical protein TTHERM_00238930 [Tetrahymena thermophila SB210]|eukprot:XP_001024818.1 hypothetical protein TTHERM_00238930 [Tetrahymena thermophila SB210]